MHYLGQKKKKKRGRKRERERLKKQKMAGITPRKGTAKKKEKFIR